MPHPLYVALYLVATAWAVGLAVVRERRGQARLELTSRAYRRFLAEPWRLATFGLATLTLAAAAPWSGDPTWDTGDSLLTGVLTYLFAPWSIGVLARAVRGAERDGAKLAAATVLFFTPCWAYDLYIWARDGYYPTSWLPNLWLSGGICLLAGLFWNLTTEGGRAIFAFSSAAWPDVPRASIWILWPWLALVGTPVAALIGAFVASYLGLF